MEPASCHQTGPYMVERLLEVNKAHGGWLGELPGVLQDLTEGVKLVHCSTARTRTTFLLLNPRFQQTVLSRTPESTLPERLRSVTPLQLEHITLSDLTHQRVHRPKKTCSSKDSEKTAQSLVLHCVLAFFSRTEVCICCPDRWREH